MPHRIKDEAIILDQGYRAEVLKEIEEPENRERKARAFKKYLCYKDQVKTFVLEMLGLQFDSDTVEQMSYALSNISFTRKVIDKLARVYNSGVTRELPKARETKKLEQLYKKLGMDSAFKKCNAYLKLQKNNLFEVTPELLDSGKWSLRAVQLPPYLYDAIEDARNREKLRCYIKSPFSISEMPQSSHSPATAQRTSTRNFTGGQVIPLGNRKDEKIADSPFDRNKEYIWWGSTYHFTTNFKGEIITEKSPDDLLNPIGVLPAVNFAENQDDSFWAIGGDDIVDQAVLLNVMLTHINHIAVTQGYGQLVMTGKDLPQVTKTGPNIAIRLNQANTDEPTPTFEFKSANPPLDQHMRIVEQQTALLLSTNDLSVSAVKSSLDSTMFPSGVAMMLDQAEARDDLKDQEQIFHDLEPKVLGVVNKWLQFYEEKKLLDDELLGLSLQAPEELNVKFNDPQVLQSESEKLNAMKMRKELGISSQVDLLMIDNPDLTKEEAEKKLMEINEEKMQNMLQFAGGIGGQAEDSNREQVGAEQPDGERDQDSNGSGDQEPQGA